MATDMSGPGEPSAAGTAAMTPISRLHVVHRTGSTNTDLVRLATADPSAWPHLSVLMARTQTAGQGRAGRVWNSESLHALTFSVLVRPVAERDMWGWIPLLAGLAAVRAVRALVGRPGRGRDGEGHDGEGHDGAAHGSATHDGAAHDGGGGPQMRVALKWPNDVVALDAGAVAIPGWGRMRKLGGILTEVLPDGEGAVVGIGLNLAGSELPVPWAGTVQQMMRSAIPGPEETGPATAGGVIAPAGSIVPERLLHAIVSEYGPLLQALDRGEHVLDRVAAECVSIGAQVQVDLPGATGLRGTVRALASDGALVVRTAHGDQVVRAGDIRHLRSPSDHPPARVTSQT